MDAVELKFKEPLLISGVFLTALGINLVYNADQIMKEVYPDFPLSAPALHFHGVFGWSFVSIGASLFVASAGYLPGLAFLTFAVVFFYLPTSEYVTKKAYIGLPGFANPPLAPVVSMVLFIFVPFAVCMYLRWDQLKLTGTDLAVLGGVWAAYLLVFIAVRVLVTKKSKTLITETVEEELEEELLDE
jgi:hypothetical protein